MEATSTVPVSQSQRASRRRTLLRPGKGWQAVNLKELWQYRDLLGILAMRDVRVRYKQTLLGILWAILQPLFTAIVFAVFFADLGGLPTDRFPPTLLFFCKLLPWQLFAGALTQAGNSLVNNQNLITKIYFPRLAIPISAVVTGVIDFAAAFGVLILMMAWYGVWPGLAILTLPLFVALALLAALAAGLWLAALNVEFRDMRYVIPFLTQFWLFVTPVVYPSSIVPPGFKRTLLGLNPMSGVVEGFRWAALGGPPPGAFLAVSVVTVAVLLTGGLFYFRRMERSFADVV